MMTHQSMGVSSTRSSACRYPQTNAAKDDSAFWQHDGKILKQRDFRD
jgi:hypothetical protein